VLPGELQGLVPVLGEELPGFHVCLTIQRFADVGVNASIRLGRG
jgi:hypothetical protein